MHGYLGEDSLEHTLMKELASGDPHSFRNFIRTHKQDFEELFMR